MDIRIEKKKGIRALFTKKGIPYLAGALFLVFVLWLLLRDNSSTLRVDARTISVGQVVRGEFNDYIRVTGQVQPITTVQLSPLEAGIVERLLFGGAQHGDSTPTAGIGFCFFSHCSIPLYI